jgi:galacturan 1,4-alpha-galacturonidase
MTYHYKENTDGADTIYSSFISFKDWIVDNGDDAISPKANSTDITITDCTFYTGSGIAIGSIGQYKDVFETIERVYVNNIKFISTLHAVYFKTWTGEQAGYPPNGGGGGLGCKLCFLACTAIQSIPIWIFRISLIWCPSRV